MKLLWINTVGLRKVGDKRALQFRRRKLMGKVLACLFVSKCRAQLATQIHITVEHLYNQRKAAMLRSCFAVLHKRVKLVRFMERRETVLCSKVIY